MYALGWYLTLSGCMRSISARANPTAGNSIPPRPHSPKANSSIPATPTVPEATSTQATTPGQRWGRSCRQTRFLRHGSRAANEMREVNVSEFSLKSEIWVKKTSQGGY